MDLDSGLDMELGLDMDDGWCPDPPLNQESEQELEVGGQREAAAITPKHQENGTGDCQHGGGTRSTSDSAARGSPVTCSVRTPEWKSSDKNPAVKATTSSSSGFAGDDQPMDAAKTVTISAKPGVAGAETGETEARKLSGTDETSGAEMQAYAAGETEAIDAQGNLADSSLSRPDISEYLRRI